MKIENPGIDSRTRVLVDTPINEQGEFVLYWMTAQRRLRWNHALEHAADVAEKLEKPLIVMRTLTFFFVYIERIHKSLLQK